VIDFVLVNQYDFVKGTMSIVSGVSGYALILIVLDNTCLIGTIAASMKFID
jgi:hypothetical protein